MSTWAEDTAAQLKRIEIIDRIDFLYDNQQYRAALPWARRLVDEFHEVHRLEDIMKKLPCDITEMLRIQRSDDDASALFLVGYRYYNRLYDTLLTNRATYPCLKRAAELGHVYARFLLGFIVYYGREGVTRDKERGLQLWVEAAQQGCGVAAWRAAVEFEDKDDYHQAVDFYRLAVKLHYEPAKARLEYLLSHPPPATKERVLSERERESLREDLESLGVKWT